MARPHPALIDLAAGRPMSLAGVDPASLVASAMEHRMHGLLHTEALDNRIRLPNEHATLLAREDLLRQRRTASLWRAHDRLTAAAAEVGTEVATFKGPTTELRWYTRTGERPCVDLDAWLRPGDAESGVELMARLEPGHDLLQPGLARLISSSRLQSVELDLGDATVDLHFDVLKVGVPSRLEDEVWARTVTMDVGAGRTARVLDPVAALLHLLVHQNKDRFRHLLGLADVARLLRSEQVDLDELVALAERGGVEVPVLESLRATLTELRVDVGAMPTASGPRVHVWRMAWHPGVRLRGAEGVAGFRQRQMLLPLLIRGPRRGSEALRRYRQQLFPAPELVAHRNPDIGGGYARKLAIGRARRLGQRRRRRAEARRPRTLPIDPS